MGGGEREERKKEKASEFFLSFALTVVFFLARVLASRVLFGPGFPFSKLHRKYQKSKRSRWGWSKRESARERCWGDDGNAGVNAAKIAAACHSESKSVRLSLSLSLSLLSPAHFLSPLWRHIL